MHLNSHFRKVRQEKLYFIQLCSLSFIEITYIQSVNCLKHNFSISKKMCWKFNKRKSPPKKIYLSFEEIFWRLKPIRNFFSLNLRIEWVKWVEFDREQIICEEWVMRLWYRKFKKRIYHNAMKYWILYHWNETIWWHGNFLFRAIKLVAILVIYSSNALISNSL